MSERKTGVPLMPVSQLLPAEARALLMSAARQPEHRRAVALDEATAKVRLLFPTFFHTEKE